jgi:hypothetical protein
MVCSKAKRRAIGPPESEGKVYIRCYNHIPINDLDMLMPGSSPNPTWFDFFLVVVPFLGGFGAAVYKIVSVCSPVFDDIGTYLLLLLCLATK